MKFPKLLTTDADRQAVLRVANRLADSGCSAGRWENMFVYNLAKDVEELRKFVEFITADIGRIQ